jgi:hypothetical protein
MEGKVVKAKINLVKWVVFLLTFIFYTGNALATASFSTDVDANGLQFGKIGSQRWVLINYTGDINQSSPGGALDALISPGTLLQWNAGGGSKYNFTMGTTPTLTLASGGNTVTVSKDDFTKDYLTGLSTALSMDVSAGVGGIGTITWNPVTTLALTGDGTALGSTTLGALDLGSTANLTMTFAITGAVFDFVTGATNTGAFSSMQAAFGQVTAAPEPGEWALMLVGMGLIGFTIYRKKYQVALPEWQNVRKS